MHGGARRRIHFPLKTEGHSSCLLEDLFELREKEKKMEGNRVKLVKNSYFKAKFILLYSSRIINVNKCLGY